MPSKKLSWSKSKINKVLEARQSGVYQTEDTREEALCAWKQLSSTDSGIFLFMKYGMFNMFNQDELTNMIAQWKINRCTCEEYNVKQLELKDGTKVWCFIVQPPNVDEAPFCPLSLAHGLMVSGFGYFVKRKDICDQVVAALRKE